MRKKIHSFVLAGLVLLIGFNACRKEENKIVGTLSGIIIDSQTGYGLANVKVSLTKNMTATNSDQAKASDITDAWGNYLIENVEIGTYRMLIEQNGYFTRIVDNVIIVEGLNTTPQQTIVAAPESGSIRIILTWGEIPYDLDSHLTGPTTSGDRFHVYYVNQYNSTPTVDLDVDDLVSYGPETITIRNFINGVYRYSVHNYSDQSSTGGLGIYNSPARVEIYDYSGLVNAFDAPAFTGTGNTWRVFELNISGTSITVNTINEYVTATYSSDMEAFKNAGTKPAQNILSF